MSKRPKLLPKNLLFEYTCPITSAVELLYRYTTDGYYPTHLGDHLNNNRYQVIHKLGWGGQCTVWVIRDAELGRHVAVKISTAEQYPEVTRRQLQTLRLLATRSSTSRNHAGCTRTMELPGLSFVGGPEWYA